MKTFDILVVGGGFSGVAAALSAARQGMRVLLAEKGNALGGAAAHALVNPFMPYWITKDGERISLSRGIFAEIHAALEADNAMIASKELFAEESLKYLLNRMLTEAGVQLLFHAQLFAVDCENEHIRALHFATRAGVLSLSATCYIDATGDAALAHFAGVPTTLGRPEDHLCQPMTLCFRIGGVDVERFYQSRDTWQASWKAAQAAGALQNPREDILVFRNIAPDVLHFNTTRVVRKNPTDPFDLTDAELQARAQVFEVYEFLKQHANGLENSYLASTASEIGVRESRMLVGDFVLTEEDCRACRKFSDAIAACNYDIDIHSPTGGGTSHYYFAPGTYYTIPYRVLLPQQADNLLVTGRCVSCDHGAQASLRIMPVVCTLGEAAGVAAALATKNVCTPAQISVPALQEILRNNGAFLGI